MPYFYPTSFMWLALRAVLILSVRWEFLNDYAFWFLIQLCIKTALLYVSCFILDIILIFNLVYN